jgi:cystathionine gamma-synthase
MNRPHNPATRAVRAGIDSDTAFGAVVPPIVLSTNFTFAGFDQKRKYDYSRSGNPTRDQLGEALAELEVGAGGIITATGMAAIALVLQALLKPVEPADADHRYRRRRRRREGDRHAGRGRQYLPLASAAAPA